MPIEKLIEIEDGLFASLTELLKNTRNTMDIQGVITISHDGSHECVTSFGKGEKDGFPLVTLYLKDKYAQFHDEFVQTAMANPEIKPLYDYLTSNGWNNNLD